MALPTGAKYRIGAVDFTVVNDGTYWYDAGAIFGVVPRVMWERVAPPMDERYRIPLGLNCLLLRSQGKTILVESGVGGKPGDRDNATPAEEGTLLTSLAAEGVAPEEVDVVINTHLHADHCGWNTIDGRTPSGEERLRLTFPNATYYLSAAEWHDGTHPNERTRATYLERNIAPLAEHSDHLALVEGEQRITDDVIFLPTPGHTEGHGAVVIRSGQEWGVYVGDMAQHRAQLERTAWTSGLDVLPLVSMETKKRLMDRCIEEGALVMFCHGPYPGVGRMTRTPQGFRKWEDLDPLEGSAGVEHAHPHE